MTSYDKNGLDADKVRARWQEQCKRPSCNFPACASQGLDLKDLQTLCSDFWRLTTEDRVHVLQSTYGEVEQGTDSPPQTSSPSVPRVSRSYVIGDKPVCFVNFCRKLGCGQSTMRKYIKGVPDMRRAGFPGHRLGKQSKEALATVKCDHFFRELHQAVAESMPEDDEAVMDDPWDQDSRSDCKFAGFCFACDSNVCRTASMSMYLPHWQYQVWLLQVVSPGDISKSARSQTSTGNFRQNGVS